MEMQNVTLKEVVYFPAHNVFTRRRAGEDYKRSRQRQVSDEVLKSKRCLVCLRGALRQGSMANGGRGG